MPIRANGRSRSSGLVKAPLSDTICPRSGGRAGIQAPQSRNDAATHGIVPAGLHLLNPDHCCDASLSANAFVRIRSTLLSYNELGDKGCIDGQAGIEPKMRGGTV